MIIYTHHLYVIYMIHMYHIILNKRRKKFWSVDFLSDLERCLCTIHFGIDVCVTSSRAARTLSFQLGNSKGWRANGECVNGEGVDAVNGLPPNKVFNLWSARSGSTFPGLCSWTFFNWKNRDPFGSRRLYTQLDCRYPVQLAKEPWTPSLSMDQARVRNEVFEER